MKMLIKRMLPLLVIVITTVIVFVIIKNPPEAKLGAPAQAKKIPVEVLKIEPRLYTVSVESFGTVRPLTSSSLTSQVSGQITNLATNFKEGGFFKKGDILLQIDERDFRAQLQIAEADLILAKQTLSEESAQAEQARADWQRLGKKGTPNDLVLRIPQLEAAKASVQSAQAQVKIAQLALERTSVRAPFDGRVLQKHIGLGQVVSSNELLADIYATDFVEIRLPIRNEDLPLINLPEEVSQKGLEPTQVLLYSDLIGDQQWQGRLVRTEGAIDDDSQQLYVVAQIDDPFSLPPPLIKIGQYVKANIIGKTLGDAIKIPNDAVYQGSFVYVEKESKIYRREIGILWQNQEETLIKSGLEYGETVVTTVLGTLSSGTAVQVMNDQVKAEGS